MTDKTQQGKAVKKTREGIPMSEESLAEYEKTWSDMDETFEYLDKQPRRKKR